MTISSASILALNLILLLVGSLSSNASEALPEDLYLASYKSNFRGIPIKLQTTLTQLDENQFVIRSRINNLLGSIKEDSHFIVSGHELIPTLYRYRVNVLGKKSERKIRFDWSQMLAHYTRSDKPERNTSYPIRQGVLDKALYQLKLQQQLYSGEQGLSYHYARAGGIKTREFRRLQAPPSEPQSYRLDEREYRVQVLEQVNPRGKKQVKIIAIPERHHHIAHLVHIDNNGKKHTARLTSLSTNAEALERFYERISQSETTLEKSKEEIGI